MFKNRKVVLTREEREHSVPICVEQAPAIIVHPSLCCPAIMQPDKPLTFFLLTTKALMLDYFPKRIEENNIPSAYSITPGNSDWFSGRIARLLHVRPWDKAKTNAKTYKEITQDEHPWFSTMEDAHDNIKATFIAQLGCDFNMHETRYENVLLKNSKNNYIGKLKTSMAEFYANRGYKYLFRIEITNHKLTEGLYDLCWITLDCDAEFENKINPDNYISPLEDLQDTLLREAVKDYGAKQKFAYNIEEKTNGFFQPDQNSPIQSYHPVYVTTKQEFTIGQLTDIHVSSRHFAFNKSEAKLIMNSSHNIGEMTHNSFKSTQDLLDQLIKQNTDILVITGDLLDYCCNLDPNQVNIEKPGNIWTALDLQKFKSDEKMQQQHPYGIDDTLVFSLIKSYYDKCEKPVFFVTGNHDSYKLPYGISPRIAFKRTNAGIPADHNLTIPEAILMFGPSFKEILKYSNFQAKYVNWFHHVFTPLSDFAIPIGNKLLIGLDWGDAEGFIGRPDYLPAAKTTLNNVQLHILKNISEQNKQCVLCSHAPLISYIVDYPLSKEGYIDCMSGNNFSLGTFEKHRLDFINKFLMANKNHYMLSGHSHRSGFYMHRENHIEWLNKLEEMTVKVKGYDLQTINNDLPSFADKTRVLVTGSAGPIPIQNLKGEMKGFGLDIPTATILNLDGQESIKVLTSTIKTAKPRFAVAMDYYDLLGPGVFKDGFTSSKDEQYTFTTKLDDDLPSEDFIDSVTFYIFKNELKEFQKVSATVTPESNSKQLILKFNLDKDFEHYFFPTTQTTFMSVKFKGNELSTYTGFKQYNYDSPWIIRMQIITDNNEYKIQRHKQHGEIPDFKWYMQFPEFQDG